MNIAICDDCLDDLLKLKTCIEGYNLKFNISLYQSAQDLIEDCQSGSPPQLIFLDIHMNGLNGFDAAKIINSKFENAKPLIIFVTFTDKYVFRGYEVAWRYVCKPVVQDQIHSYLDLAYKICKPQYLEVPFNGRSKFISINEILYIEVFHKIVTVHTVHADYTIHTSLREIEEELPNDQFVRSHNSYIVNLTHIEEIIDNDVRIKNEKNISVPLSRPKKDEFWVAYSQYLKRGAYV